MKQTLEQAFQYFRPPPKLKVSDWADEFRIISQANAEPGRWRTDRAPYQREMMDAVCDPTVRRVTAMTGAQIGKTDALINNVIGYYISQDPKSIMVMHPTLRDLTTWLEAKLNPMLEETEVVKERIAKPRGREGVNNQQMKSFHGGFLMFAYSGSSNTMRGRSAPIILCDEIDGYEGTDEGDPINLLWQRAATFGDQRKLVLTSTPTVKNASRIETSFLAGDQRRYWCPCPHCEVHQTLKWQQVFWESDESDDPEVETVHYPDTAHYVCEHCGSVITDGDKMWMVRHGEWRAEKPFTGHASFHISELYSPWRRWSDIVESFLEKKRSGDLQSFANVSLAETWGEGGEAVDDDALMLRAEDYDMPEDVLCLIATVDVQQDRLEYEVVGYNRETTWGIDYKVIWGDTGQDDVWKELDALLLTKYSHPKGFKMPIAAAGIDSGYNTQKVYDFCKPRFHRRVFCLKGVTGWGKPVVSAPAEKKYGANARPVKLFTVGVDEAKRLVHASLKIEEGEPGYCHFPKRYPKEFFRMLGAEELRTKYIKGVAKQYWHKTRPRNEALDLRAYQKAVIILLDPKWELLESTPVYEVHETPVRRRRVINKGI